MQLTMVMSFQAGTFDCTFDYTSAQKTVKAKIFQLSAEYCQSEDTEHLTT